MVIPYILAICLCGVFCLIPVALYLHWLSRVAHRDRPTAVSGSWDFAGLLFGLSGFIVFGGGLLLTLFQSNFRYWMRGNVEALRAAWIQERVTWSLLVAFYFVFVIGGALLVLAARRRSLVVYNVEPGAFEAALAEVFDHLGRPVERRGKLWASDVPLCEVDAFEAGHTVTLRWVSNDQRLFEDVVRQLRAALATQTTSENPASRWLTTAAVGSGTVVLCCFGLLLYGLSLLSR